MRSFRAMLRLLLVALFSVAGLTCLNGQEMGVDVTTTPGACPCDPPVVTRTLWLQNTITNAVLWKSFDLKNWKVVATNIAGVWHGQLDTATTHGGRQFFRLTDWEFSGGKPPYYTVPDPIRVHVDRAWIRSVRPSNYVTTDGLPFGPGAIRKTLEWSVDRIKWGPASGFAAGGNTGMIFPDSINYWFPCDRMWVRETDENDFGKVVAMVELIPQPFTENGWKYFRTVPGDQRQP